MATLRDVARLAGVSTMTVSRVVNNCTGVKSETRARVESAIAQLGFVPNAVGRLLAKKRSRAGFSSTLRIPNVGSAGNQIDRSFAASELVHNTSPDERDLVAAEPSNVSGDTARTMLRIVRAAQPISRVDLARRLEVNRSTVTVIVTPLIASGVLREAAPEAAGVHRRGRPAI